MTVYFKQKLEIPDSGAIPVLISWHPKQALVAVTSASSVTGGYVTVHNDKGLHAEECTLSRSCIPTTISWHPRGTLLVAGWETGEVTAYSHMNGKTYIIPGKHNNPISVVGLSPMGLWLITADKVGVLFAWRIDLQNAFPFSQYFELDITKGVTQCIFHQKPSKRALPRGGHATVNGKYATPDGVTSSGEPSCIMERLAFYLAADDGTMYYVDEHGSSTVQLSCKEPILKMMLKEGKDIIIIITESLYLSQFSINSEGNLEELAKVKLGCKLGEFSDIIWAQNVLVTAAGESVLRLWDLECSDNCTVGLNDMNAYVVGETITCMAYSPSKGILAGGTSRGNIAMWKKIEESAADLLECGQRWRLHDSVTLSGNITHMKWCMYPEMLAVSSPQGAYLLKEQAMCSHYSQHVAAVQVSPTELYIKCFFADLSQTIQMDSQVLGVWVTNDTVTVWDDEQICIFKLTEDEFRKINSFQCESTVVVVYEQNIFTTKGRAVQVHTLQGTVKQVLSFSEMEGSPNTLHVGGSHLLVATDNCYICVFDLSRREAKAQFPARDMKDVVRNLGPLTSAQINATSCFVGFLRRKANGNLDSHLYVYIVETDHTLDYDFAGGESSSDLEDAAPGIHNNWGGTTSVLKGRYPISLHWDQEEPHLLVCETVLIEQPEDSSAMNNVLVVSFFCSEEHGLHPQEIFTLPQYALGLLGLQAPYYYFMSKGGSHDSSAKEADRVTWRALRDFVGLEDCAEETKDALLKFSYHLTVGNTEEAFRAIRLIKSEIVWKNMARMCVKSRHLDMGRVCLGKMGNARAARAVRESEQEPELEARLAMMALQLGMNDEAEELYRRCERYDLLNKLYQASGQWEKAVELAEKHVRIHMRNTHYKLAHYMEEKGDVDAAIHNYEKSETHRVEVPRMLFDNKQALQAYIAKSKDRSLVKWWGQYLESIGMMQEAYKYFETAQDYQSRIRIHCILGEINEAAAIANETGDKVGYYHLARHCETHEDVKRAIHFYTQAHAYNNALRLCKDHQMYQQLMNLALLSSPEDMMETARYFEDHCKQMDRAVTLYHKAGHLWKAVQLAFATEQFDALQHIVEELDENSDPDLLARCSEFCLQHGLFEKAVHLLLAGKKLEEALEICEEHDVIITEELAEKMTLIKDPLVYSDEHWRRLLLRVANCCMLQRNYKLAAKKYTQSGNKCKAIRALMKSGDTEKIIFFANVAKHKEVYIMAGNYLQSLEWRNQSKVVEHIINFYTKAQALDLLAGFYDSCSQIEIEECQNYEAGLKALMEAHKCLSERKCISGEQDEKKLQLQNRITFLKKFLLAKSLLETNSQQAEEKLQALFEDPVFKETMHPANVFTLLVQHHANTQDYQMANKLLMQMRSKYPSISMQQYVSQGVLDAISHALHLPPGRWSKQEEEVHDETDNEEIVDENL
uniref:intraflagellar transport protein 140 homolog n=1 Tax=Myxine glutinosa TaxID=7769 RepID=UPI00358F9C54